MPHGRVRDVIPATSREVFDLLHDYGRRLQWDTLLSEAYLTDGHTAAAVGAVSVCRGQRRLGAIALKTRYLVFKPGEVAAITMVNRPQIGRARLFAALYAASATPGRAMRCSASF